jgi:anti-sigma regulatory factor (Ser/Thr protein kinase)
MSGREPTVSVPEVWAERRFPCAGRSVGPARAALRKQLDAWAVAMGDAEDAALLLSEIFTNAVRHTGAPPGGLIWTRYVVREGTLRVEVSDVGGSLPQPRIVDRDAESGRGLLLVSTLSSAWGVCPRPHGVGKCVWFELKLSPLSVTQEGDWC